jgi:hypothetical protein
MRFPLLLAFLLVAHVHAAEVADYRFADSHSSSIGGAPALQQIAPGGGSFVDTVVDGVSQRAWAFPEGSGFSLPIAGLVPDSQYSIALLLRTEVTGGYTKLLDLSSRTSDAGLYYSGGSLVFFPGAISAPPSVEDNRWHLVVLTRAVDGDMIGYVDGVQQFRFFDLDANGVVLDGQLVFLRDDLEIGGEDATGIVARIRVFDHLLSPEQVRALRPAAAVFRDGFEAATDRL